jgi:5-methyltetrahydrofolate--homocysteine methyltransferase
MAIANPSQEMLICGALATDLLIAKPDADLRYIEYANNMTPTETKIVEKKENKSLNNNEIIVTTDLEKIKNAVIKGNRNGISVLVKEALENGEEPQNILNNSLLPAINLVGQYFEQKKYFLPQLIAGAETMKNAMDILEEKLLVNASNDNMPVVVIATVEGDIHDIGKNLVAMMLKNYGFKVIDLGKDVPTSEIISACKNHNADMIALSALMTTTMQKMRDVVAEVTSVNLPVKVMIGGAVTTPEFAEEIGADGYSKDAADAVKLAQRLLMLTQK